MKVDKSNNSSEVRQQETTEVLGTELPDSEDMVVNRWKTKYEEQRRAVDLLKQEHEAAIAQTDLRIHQCKEKINAVLELSGKTIWQCSLVQ